MMRTAYRSMVVLGVVVLGWGSSSMIYHAGAAGGDAGKGKAIFQAKCVTCHGAEGKGDGPLGKKLKPPAEILPAPKARKSPRTNCETSSKRKTENFHGGLEEAAQRDGTPGRAGLCADTSEVNRSD